MPANTPAAITEAIVAPFRAAAEIATAIDTVATALDGARSVVLVLENRTQYKLERVSDSHTHGGFDVTPSAVVPARSTAVFSSKDTGVMTGTEGQVTYRVDDDTDEETLFQIAWKNPFIGRNDAEALAYYNAAPAPPPHPVIAVRSEHYDTVDVCGGGDTEVEMRFSLKRF
jgi:hypothetical protein